MQSKPQPYWNTFLLRLRVAWKVMFGKRIVFSDMKDRTYFVGVNMNEMLRFQSELTIFLEKILQSAKEQQDAVNMANEILNNKS